MACIKIHGSPFSTATSRALCALHEKDLEYELVRVDLRIGEHKKEPFISINPFGQVPGLEDGDLKLFESRAITQYLAHAYADKGTNLIALEPKKMALVGTWVEVEAHHFDPPASKLTWELAAKPLFNMGPSDTAVVEENLVKLSSVLDVYEKQLSKSKYLAGDFFSLADLHHLPNLSYVRGTSVDELIDCRPHVKAWVDDILSRPAWVKTAEMRVKHD